MIEYGGDLEAFAKHAKRSTVQADDVKLLVRRNRGLVRHSAVRLAKYIATDTIIQ